VKKTGIDRIVSRRELLALAGVTAAAALLGCRRDPEAAAGTPPCIVRPEQTEGPYFVDERLNRSDIRSDPADGSVREGVPLELALRVSRIGEGSCDPIRGALVDLWQCDALGVYSDVQDFAGRFDTRGRKFLRGHQTTGADGTARFLTIYPGWYHGRTPHIHFKIRTDPGSRRGYEFTSQLYFDDSVTDLAYKEAPYNTRGPRTTTNRQDGIFRRGGDRLMLDLVRQPKGYAGMFDIGLRIA
jgi:protocatechuate 3,4-dioxygenase beta subunit